MKMPTAVIREEIQIRGAISFARFMELALYCPETGYYERNRDNVGRAGDFITSVSTGSLFGELLAFQFAEWLQEMRSAEGGVRIIEAGAHDGKLAADILDWLKNFRPELFAEIKYGILEPSETRRRWQKTKLAAFGSQVHWLAQVSELENWKSEIGNQKSWPEIIFSNELLDAFPVRRFGWDAKGKKWFEWGVALDGEKFVWSRIKIQDYPAQSSDNQRETFLPLRVGGVSEADGERAGVRCSSLPASIRHLPSSLLDVLPDGYIIEDSPAAENWWRQAAQVLQRGKLLAIDYGFTAEEQFSPARTKGTLRAYCKHQVSDDLLASPGEQDLTAHVNFSAIQSAGETAGLKTETFCSQPQFLTRILQKAVTDKSFAALDAKKIRQFQTLTHPEHLGRAFRVLVQSK